jgi:LysM repeat protein
LNCGEEILLMMLSRKILLLFALATMLLLAGCFRQAEETFEPIDSQSSGGQPITAEPSDLPEETDIPVLVIDPNASEDAAETEEPVETEEPTEAEAIDTNEPLVAEASPTLRVINPTTAPIASSTRDVIPTATEAQVFITPAVNVEAVIPTASATVFVDQPTLQPTPTNEGGSVVVGDCQYEIQSGDTLFRIAINNDVALAELLEANNLSDGSIIQPGQILTIPNCNSEEAPEALETEESTELTECDYVVQAGDTLFEIALNNELVLADLLEVNDLTEASIIQPGQALRLPDCEDGASVGEEETVVTEAAGGEVVHTVVRGDTLLSIARNYGVTVNDIIQANNIPNPNNLTIGQQLVIPQP